MRDSDYYRNNNRDSYGYYGKNNRDQEYYRSGSSNKYGKKSKRRRKARRKRTFLVVVGIIALIIVAVLAVKWYVKDSRIDFLRRTAGAEEDDPSQKGEIVQYGKVEVSKQYLDVGIARNGKKLQNLNGIVVHYVANPGSTAQENHDYFASPTTNVCSHFVIGLNGEVIQCLPLDEMSAASNDRNIDTISIEVCHPDETGEPTVDGYNSLVYLCAWLCDNTGLKPDNIIRHYDVTGKMCPLYFVEHPDMWEQFKVDVERYMN